MEKTIGIVITIIIGLIFITIGVYFRKKDEKLKENGVKSQAKILEKKIGIRNRAYVTVEYTVEYKVIIKRIVTARSIYKSYPFNEGEKTIIYYDKKDPKSFCFENDKRHIAISNIFFCAGGLEIIVAILSFFLN
ncbi:Uncharacterised protein [Sebaldella termitidis]|uniref:DUF3592 domain-containing protein n=1 Tax=Sebaldella termitidis (strain ATCC 33386 / NCTC 11300) TaxID=526218 RepID=D1AH87_SEBTE|nr:DUF3592 domain-containing protein [Sebaldella termitidis]ACZ08121.1 hypothetical protein Sterm_1254 [Sebaldella termitidis ATCC 33386]SUI23423.1 Uncharacterised protein [Sebaldella termitidis]